VNQLSTDDVPTTRDPAPRRGDASADDVATAALATVREVTAEIVRLVRTAATQAADGWSLGPIVRALLPDVERLVEERTALGTEARGLRARVGDLDARVRELEALLAAREAGWRAERAAFADDVVRERDKAEMLAQDLERRRAEIGMLEGRTRRLREQMDAAATRHDADREKTLRLAREMVQSAEEARVAVVGEMESLRAALAAEQARLDETQHERARATQGVAELEADLAHARQIIEQLEASRAGAAAELARSRTTLVQTEGDLLAVQHAHQLAHAQLEKLCAAHDEMVEDQAQLTAKLHGAQEREARLRLRITGLEQRLQASRDGGVAPIEPSAAAIDAVVQAATAGLTTDLARAEERTQALRDELARTKAAASAATVRAETLHAELHAAERGRIAAVEEVESLRAATAEPPAPAPVVPPAPVVQQVAVPVVEACESFGVEDVAPEPHAAPEATVVVLDTFDGWSLDVLRVTPSTNAHDYVRELAPSRCLVNVGAPGALDTVVELRRAGVATPLWGFAMAPDTAALAIGRFDVIVRPVDPARVRAQLGPLVARDGNVIMVGSESATLMPLREGLTQMGLSVRTAWNPAQAVELAEAVEPDVVVIDLGTAAAGAAELVVELSRRDRPPAIVFVPGTAEYLEVLAAAVGAHGTPIDREGFVRAAATALEPAA
jgi:CheY-like chemotaxis protein